MDVLASIARKICVRRLWRLWNLSVSGFLPGYSDCSVGTIPIGMRSMTLSTNP